MGQPGAGGIADRGMEEDCGEVLQQPLGDDADLDEDN